jgi:hypothetical protein
MMTQLRREMAQLFDQRTIEDLVKLSPDGASLAFDI